MCHHDDIKVKTSQHKLNSYSSLKIICIAIYTSRTIQLKYHHCAGIVGYRLPVAEFLFSVMLKRRVIGCNPALDADSNRILFQESIVALTLLSRKKDAFLFSFFMQSTILSGNHAIRWKLYESWFQPLFSFPENRCLQVVHAPLTAPRDNRRKRFLLQRIWFFCPAHLKVKLIPLCF